MVRPTLENSIQKLDKAQKLSLELLAELVNNNATQGNLRIGVRAYTLAVALALPQAELQPFLDCLKGDNKHGTDFYSNK
jgi:hypothetical protein